MPTPAASSKQPKPTTQATPEGGLYLSPDDCRSLEQGFGLPASQIIRDVVEQARQDSTFRR